MPSHSLIPRPLLPFAAALVIALAADGAPAAEVLTGEQIYKTKCVTCHGSAGEGSKTYPHALAGEKSLPKLTSLIAKTMPDDDPGILSALESEKVATYVYDTFYSAAARETSRPPRIELSRLTVRQYRNAVADLIGSFRGQAPPADKQGLSRQYFRNRRGGNEPPAETRIDPQVHFNFGTGSPDPKLEPNNFSIRWEGSIIAPETGDYEFLVRTEHSARLWINDPGRPLIDAWVRSGTDTEHKGSVFLVGGRAYAVRLEFSKARLGDQKLNPITKPVPASVSLLWKRPRGALEVVAARHLSPAKVPEVFVTSVPFPPDDRSLGWERGSAVSKAWDQAETDAAIDTAGYVASKLAELAGTTGRPADREAKARSFARKFVERAFRRPLTAEQERVFIDRQFEAARDPEVAIKRVVLLTLKSPRFLYKEAGTAADGYAVAERLAFAVWDSLPDRELLDAAAAGKLTNRDDVRKQADRMLADPRAKVKLREFLFTWLKVDQAPDLSKDTKRFPGFDPAVAGDLRTSLELSLDDVVWSDASDFRQLFLSEDVYLNGRLMKFYVADSPIRPFGIDLLAQLPFQKRKLDSGQRAGVLTHPYLMSSFAYTGASSPIHRGVFLARGVLGRTLRPPQDAFTPLPEDLHPTLTTRERVALQTKSDNCQACHGLINPLGFTLEHFDAVGRFRDTDNGKPVQAAGTYQTRTGELVTFAGARDLAKFLAATDEVSAAFAERLFHHLAQQPVRAYGPNTLADLRKGFAANGYNVRKLAAEIAAMAALPPRGPPNIANPAGR